LPFPIAQIETFTGGRLTIRGNNNPGVEFAFTALTDLTNSIVDVDGVDVAMVNVVNVDRTDLLVQGGVTLTLPTVINYEGGNTINQSRTWRATGPPLRPLTKDRDGPRANVSPVYHFIRSTSSTFAVARIR